MLSQMKALPGWLTESADRNVGTVWQIVKAYRANQRQGTVGVKTRATVASTGKKPYKQKKTGGARRGSFVANLHVGGGVSHGPKMRDYRQALPSQMTQLALKIALAKKMQAGSVFSGEFAVESGKTKDGSKAIGAAHSKIGTTVVCLSQPSELTLRALRNLRGVQLVSPEQLNAFHIVQARSVVISAGALKALEQRV
jgi:large subunit ribosomal protein L4